MTDITPFEIAASAEVIDDLRERLRRTRFPEAETVDDWSQGIPLAYVQELVEYWANDYDWSARQDLLNAWPQFKTTIDDLGVHFIHVRSPHEDAFPLIITHGWPGSIVEFQNVIGPLTNPTEHGGDAADAFHVVCPSIPGFGFSDKPTTTGCGVAQIGAMWGQLMARLGYERYGAQGGDWGSPISSECAVADPDHCVGLHLNMPVAAPDPTTMADLTEVENDALAAFAHYDKEESGYSKQQSTRPQTMGYGLVDSPAAQAAWIIEKFWGWTDHDGHPEDVATRDQLLDNVMMYWLPGTGASSARLYWESFGNFVGGEVKTPMGASIFPREIIRTSQRWAAQRYKNIISWNIMEEGGHFAALEQPEAYVRELRSFFALVR